MKTFLLLVAITCGIFFPYGYDYTFLIRYFLMVLLFFSFLEVKIGKEIVTVQHFIILTIMIGISLMLYFIIKPFDPEAAQSAFIMAIGPTAIAAPVIISLKKGKVEFVTFSLLLNNIVIALLLPLLLPFILAGKTGITVMEILIPVVITLAIPLVAAQIVKSVTPKVWKWLVEWKDSAFYLLILNIYIATSDAADYISNESPEHYSTLLLIGLLAGALCVFLFSLGWIVGGKEYAAEASQSLGQKNNAFTIWIALAYMNPVAVIGPVFYVMFQNIYISWELYMHNRRENKMVNVNL